MGVVGEDQRGAKCEQCCEAEEPTAQEFPVSYLACAAAARDRAAPLPFTIEK